MQSEDIASTLKQIIHKSSSIEIKDSNDFEMDSCGIGGRVWKSAVVLESFLSSNKINMFLNFENKTVIELGSGTGVCGLMASKQGAKKVYLTDRDVGCLELLQKNIDLNENKINKDAIEIVSLSWGNERDNSKITDKIDIILGSDILYSMSMVDGLYSAVEYLCGKDTIILFSLAKRVSDDYDSFINKLEIGNFTIETIPEDLLDEMFYNVSILLIKRK